MTATTLRIGTDADALRRPLSGVGQYVYNLGRELEALLPEASFYAYSRLPASALALPSARWKLRRETLPALRHIPSFVWLKTRCRRLSEADQLDVFWAGRTLYPRLPREVCVVSTVHDLNHLIVPETMERKTRWSHKLWFERDVRAANCVLANSLGTAERVRALLNVQVHGVVLPGLASHFGSDAAWHDHGAGERLAALGIRAPYLLAVATAEPRKNLEAVLEAYLVLKRAGELEGFQLVLVGGQGWNNRALSAKVSRARADGVVAVGDVPDELLPLTYAGAEALVFPSLYEGFGMPVLEARACGTRVVISDVPELREAAGSGAVVVEPSVTGIRDGIRAALALPRNDPADTADRHSWRRSAQGLAAHLLRASAAMQTGAPARCEQAHESR